jgi:hypothetical protein
MAATRHDRALTVCGTCKARKKACDKGLPKCGFCSKRGLACNYNLSALASLHTRAFLASPTSASNQATSSGVWHVPSTTLLSTKTLEWTLNYQVCSITESLGRSFEDICKTYYQTLHEWFPVVDAKLFVEAASAQVPPAVDFSVLLLAMCVISQDPAHDEFFNALKVMLAQVQAAKGVSTKVVQGNLLVAAYEYARGWVNQAYVTTGACTRIAHALRLKGDSSRDSESRHILSSREEEEEQSIWLCTQILERLAFSIV